MPIKVASFLFIFCVISRLGSTPIPSSSGGADFFESQFNKTLECIRLQLINGNVEIGLPPLSPWITNETIHLKFTNKYISPDLLLNDLVIDGITTFETTSITLSPLMQLDVNFHFKKLSVKASYVGTANLLSIVCLYGEGKFNFEFSNVQLNTTTQFAMAPPLISNHKSKISLEKAVMNVTGIFNDEEISQMYSTLLSQAITIAVNRHQEEISNHISPYIQDFFSDQIGHLNFLDFLEEISNVQQCSPS